MNCCEPTASNQPCCKLESVVNVDERGQMILPKEIREKAKIRAGDKLALVSWAQGNEVSCIFLIKSEKLNESVQQLMAPVLTETIK